MKTLGKYEVLEEIAGGGMGKICRARDRVLHREVAIKTISTGQTDPEIKQRFYREARSCAALSHPNIVTVFDLGEQQGVSYIAMELLDGEDLRRFIDRRGAMSLEAKTGLMGEVCDGLAHAHDNGIIHRDLKPGNIFITKSGRPKILDFGIARISASHLTEPGTALGTPRYMAPEQYLGKECTALSDLFSISMVFFEFLTYTHPFDDSGRRVSEGPSGGRTPARLASEYFPNRIIKEEPLSLSSLNPALPERLTRIFSKALSKDPNARYQTASELAKDVRKVSVDLVRECSKLWSDVLDHRKRVLELESTLEGYLRTSWMQTLLKKEKADLASVENIRPDASATVISDLHYFDLLTQLDDIKRAESLLAAVAEDVSKARHDAEEARILLKEGDIEGATKIVLPLAERFPDHSQITSLMREVRLRSSALAMEKALSENNLINAVELLDTMQSIGCSDPESTALVESLRTRVESELAAKDVLRDRVRTTIRQLQNAATGDDGQRIEKLAASLAELTEELKRRYSSDKMPDEIKELLSSCQETQHGASFQAARIKVRRALVEGDLQAARESLQVVKELCADNPQYENRLAEVQREVVESILVSQCSLPLSGADTARKSHAEVASAQTMQALQSSDAGIPIVEAIEAPVGGHTQDAKVQSDGSIADRRGETDGFVKTQGAATQVTPASSRICPVCGARNPITDVKCSQCLASLAEATGQESPPQILRHPKMRFLGVCMEAMKNLARILQTSSRKVFLLVQHLSPVQRRIVLPLVAAVIMIPLLYVLFHSNRTRTINPIIVGKAHILGKSVSLQSEPRPGARPLGAMSSGEPVEILNNMPAKALDAWVAVRRQSGRSAVGYVTLNQLAAADTGSSEFDLWHARSVIPDPNKSDPVELSMRLNEAETALAHVLEGAESLQLQLRLANDYAVLAERTLPDYAGARKYAESAGRYLDRLRDQSSVASEWARVRAVLDGVMKAISAKAPKGGAKKSANFSRSSPGGHARQAKVDNAERWFWGRPVGTDFRIFA